MDTQVSNLPLGAFEDENCPIHDLPDFLEINTKTGVEIILKNELPIFRKENEIVYCVIDFETAVYVLKKGNEEVVANCSIHDALWASTPAKNQDFYDIFEKCQDIKSLFRLK